MARAGAQVTGIDIVERSIEVARQHAQRSGLDIDYRCQAAEDLLATDVEPFDWVLNLEVVEHVNDLPSFLNTTAQLVSQADTKWWRPLTVILSGLVAIFGAEYVLGLLPKGTHQYSKLVKPVELAQYLMNSDCPSQSSPVCNLIPLQSVPGSLGIPGSTICVSQRVAQHG